MIARPGAWILIASAIAVVVVAVALFPLRPSLRQPVRRFWDFPCAENREARVDAVHAELAAFAASSRTSWPALDIAYHTDWFPQSFAVSLRISVVWDRWRGGRSELLEVSANAEHGVVARSSEVDWESIVGLAPDRRDRTVCAALDAEAERLARLLDADERPR